MNLRYGLMLSAGLCISACGTERARPADGTAGKSLRSEEARIALPSSPAALAKYLGVSEDSLRAAGEERYTRQAFDSAQAIWRVEIVRARAVPDRAAEARARMWLGLVAWKLGDFKSARREGEAALATKRAIGLDAELSRSYNALGLLAWNEGRHHDALAMFDSALVSARRNKDAAGVARASANIPLVQVELGDFDGARRGLATALTAARKIDDERTQGNVLANQAMLEIRVGNPQKSLPLLAEARKRYAKIEYGVGEANALGQLATAWSALGDLQRAIAAADSALAIARAEGLQQEIAAELEVIADLHAQGGSSRLALRSLLEADSLDTLLGLRVERGTNLRRVSTILLDLGETPSAISRAREALAVHQQVDASGEAAYDRIALARALSRNGDHGLARAQADSGARKALLTRNPAIQRDAVVVGAELALESGDAESALKGLRQLEPSSKSSDWRVSDLRAKALLALGRLTEAAREGEAAVMSLERERGSLGFGPLRSEYLANRSAPFSDLAAIQLSRRDTAAAFAVAASLPGRSISERLGEVTGPPPPIEAVVRGEQLLRRAAELERKISELAKEDPNREQRASLQTELERTRAQYEQQVLLQGTSPRANVLGLSNSSLRDVQGQLGEHDALLLFLSGPQRLDMFLVRPTSVLHRSAAIGDKALAVRVRFAREILSNAPASRDARSVFGELHDLLFRPLVDANAVTGIESLLIVPHGSLGALPFAALWSKSDGKFLVERYVLSYLPAVGALGAQREVPATTDRAVIFAPMIDSLPGTLREARAIAGTITAAQIKTGSASSESAVRTALAADRPVHIASHGSHNSQNPLFSRVMVGSKRTLTPSNDGELEVHEILGLRTASPLVFLSGCETALGSAGETVFGQGSDENSLAQAFLVAGAGSVVATLWRVDDASAVQVATSFYRNMRPGIAPEYALARAQREEISHSAGYTWAAYTVSGTGKRKSGKGVRRTVGIR